MDEGVGFRVLGLRARVRVYKRPIPGNSPSFVYGSGSKLWGLDANLGGLECKVQRAWEVKVGSETLFDRDSSCSGSCSFESFTFVWVKGL